MTGQHLAQLNVGRLVAPTDDPRVAAFMDNLDRVNAIAERSDGFVWRMTGDGNDATDIKIGGDPLAIANLSVWRDVESLERFVWGTLHRRFYERRAEWFEPPVRMHFVMWRIEAGTTPTLDEALERLDHLRAHGPGDRAFGWESLPEARLWRSRRCAGAAA